MTCQHCKENCKNNKPATFCQKQKKSNEYSPLWSFSFVLQRFTTSGKFHIKRKNSTFHFALPEENDFTSRFPAHSCYRVVTVIVVGNSAAPGPRQIVGFSEYHPLTNREKEVLIISASTRCAEPTETAKYSVFTAGIHHLLSITLNFAYLSPAKLGLNKVNGTRLGNKINSKGDNEHGTQN